MTVQFETTALPTSVVIEWARSGKAPPAWRVFPGGAVRRKIRWEFLSGLIFAAYPFVVCGAIFSLARFFISSLISQSGTLAFLGSTGIIFITILGGGIVLWSVYRLLKPIQQRWPYTRDNQPRNFFMFMLKDFPLWVSITFISGLTACFSLLTSDELIAGLIIILLFPVLLVGVLSLLIFAWQSSLILIGNGFVENIYSPSRYDYALIASMALIADSEGLKIVYTTGGTVEWMPTRKYGFSAADIIWDYERYKARHNFITVISEITPYISPPTRAS
jgi:hypothetical protein